jgi:hypothetical protein
MGEPVPIGTTEVVAEDKKEFTSKPVPRARFSLEAFERILSILASVATAAGIFFAIYQIRLSNTIEKRGVAVEAIRQTRTAEFIKAFRQLKTAYETRQVDEKDKDSLIDSLNHVMNVYDDIAVLYLNDIADKCIIKDSIYSSAKEMAAISAALSPSPPEKREHFNSLLRLMDQESCENRHLSPPNEK